MQDLLRKLIPVDEFSTGFTTCESIVHAKLERCALADNALGVHKVSTKTPHPVVEPPPAASTSDGPRHAWEALYPQGSINPSGAIPGGFGFYLAGPPAFAARLETATEAVFSYRMMLQPGWEWVKGGKLPVGGVGGLAYGCTGGRKEHRCQCVNVRPMWRPEGVGELYTYLPLVPQNAKKLSEVPPRSVENSDYGFSVGRGAFLLHRGVADWVTLAFRIKLNDVGIDNGELQMWVDGVSVIDIAMLSLRDSEESKIKGMHFQTFFGGHSEEWASPKDQRAWFSDVTGVIVR